MARNLARNSVAGFAGNLAQKGVAFATTLVIARGLGEQAFGVYSIVGVFLFFFGFFTDLGIERVLTRELARSPARAPVLLGNAILLRLLLCSAAVPAAVGAAWLMGLDPEVRYCVFLAALCLPLSLDLLFRSFFQAIYRMETVYRITVTTALTYLGLSAVCVSLRLPVYALFWAGLLNAALTLLLFVAAAARHVRPNLRADKSILRMLLRDAGQMGAFVLMFMLAMRVDQLLLFRLRGTEEVAYYAVAVRLTEMLSLIPEALMLSVFPLLVSTQHSAPERFGEIYRLSFKYLTILVLPVALGLTLARTPVVTLAFGARYVPGTTAVAILSWGMFFAYTGAVYLNLFIVQSLHRLMLLVSVLALLLNVGLNLVLIPPYGAAGAAAATVLSNLAGFAFWVIHPHTASYMRVCVRESMRPVLSVAAAAAAVFLPGLQGGAALVAAAAVYGVVLWITRGVTREDAEFLRALFAREPTSMQA